MYGPIAFTWDDETVDLFGDKIQEEINLKGEWTWKIKIRTYDNLDLPWEKIEWEPKSPTCTLETIRNKCGELLKKYPAIQDILIVAKENSKLVYMF